MIDFHSHILPGIDDGSRDAATSLLMLNALKKQGADTVCATSHFYATQRSVDRFLFRRQEAWDRLQEVLPQDAPRILLSSDAHNMSSRAPNLEKARARIAKSLGEETLEYIDNLGSSLLPTCDE